MVFGLSGRSTWSGRLNYYLLLVAMKCRAGRGAKKKMIGVFAEEENSLVLKRVAGAKYVNESIILFTKS